MTEPVTGGSVTGGAATPGSANSGEQRRWPALARAGEVVLGAAGGLVSLAGGLLVALLTVLWLPWRVDLGFAVVRVPLAPVIAAAGVLLLLWYAPRATGTRWAVLLPGAGWLAVVVAAVGPIPGGGRLLMPDDLLAAATLFLGTIVLVVGAVLILTTSPPTSAAAPAGRS